jgi:hypothetical protein
MSERRVRLARVIGFGLLAEVATALTILVVLQVHSRLIASGDDQAITDFARRASAILGPGLGILFTYMAALRASGPMPDQARLHGFLVGVVAGILTIPGIFVGAPEMRPIYAGAIALKLAAGWAAGAQIEWTRSQT